MNSYLDVSALMQSAGSGLTTTDVVDALPRDPASIFVLVLFLLSMLAVLWFGRPRGGGGTTP